MWVCAHVGVCLCGSEPMCTSRVSQQVQAQILQGQAHDKTCGLAGWHSEQQQRARYQLSARRPEGTPT